MSFANYVALSSGQILFADPTKPWSPDDFPQLPSTNIAITATGTIATRNISTIAFSNAISYEPFEPLSDRPNLQKQLQIDSAGRVSFADAKVGYVSTLAAAFEAPVSSFLTSSIGGANIVSYPSSDPDTVTNAIAKLDAWIANSFLYQPPAVAVTSNAGNSLYGAIQWRNFNTYALLDKSVPYVNSMLFIIGDPSASNFCSIEIKDSVYFPWRTFVDGISPNFFPIVKLRIFTDFFPNDGTVNYTKSQAASRCIKVIAEQGNLVVPPTGRVFSVQNTNGESTFTTFSVYLPNITASYPKDTSIPVGIVYLNATSGSANVAQTTTTITSDGWPSELSSIYASTATASTAQLLLVRPEYSDADHFITEPYFSTYNVSYGLSQYITANSSGDGYRYGLSTLLDRPSYLSTYATAQTHAVCYTSPIQTAIFNTLVPGLRWSTSVVANSFARAPAGDGEPTIGPFVSTLFPTVAAPRISSVTIQNTGAAFTRAANTLYDLSYGAQGWIVGNPVSTDVVFFSTPVAAPIQINTAAQFNDASYPGDRNNIAINMTYTNTSQTKSVVNTLLLSSVNQSFLLGSYVSSATVSSATAAYITDTQSADPYKDFFYKTNIYGSFLVSTLSTAVQGLGFNLSNRFIANYASAPTARVLSTPNYLFRTEPDTPTFASSAVITYITSTTQICGLVTPSLSSQMFFDVYGMNFAHFYARNRLVDASAVIGPSNAGTSLSYNSNIRVLSNATELSTLPYTQNVILNMSSLIFNLNSNVYSDPTDTDALTLYTTLVNANPIYDGSISTLTSTTLSNVFIDTVSYPTFQLFNDPTQSRGQRVLSLMPRIEDPGTATNIGDGVDSNGLASNGLDVATSSFFIIGESNDLLISSFVNYEHASSLQQALYTDFYARELVYTNGVFMHPAGMDFSVFTTSTFKVAGFYPNFTYDLSTDTNYGYRYVSFVREFPEYVVPTAYRYAFITVNNPSLISTIQTTRSENNWWPNSPVDTEDIESMKVRMHFKLITSYYNGFVETYDSAWLNGFKHIDLFMFADSNYDDGALLSVTNTASNVTYKVAYGRRFYNKICFLVRIGISRDGGVLSGSEYPITFTDINVVLSDI
jgi:hypothetical protein